MTVRTQKLAPAKVNLGLRVLPKRTDGFHDIESIFQTIELKDILDVSVCEGTGNCSVFCEQISLPPENTLSLAYKAFCALMPKPVLSVNVKLTKRIPAGGGLGGGSSDAVALVRALEEITEEKLQDEQLDQIAGAVGSDVFFFCHCGKNIDGAALVTGRGENVKNIKKRRDLHFVLVFPNVFSSTKEAYSLVDELYETDNQVIYPPLDKLESIYNRSIEEWTFCNTFTPALTSRYKEIEYCLNCIHQSGALFSDMSGSGSTVFGVFEQRENAINAIELLTKQGLKAVLA